MESLHPHNPHTHHHHHLNPPKMTNPTSGQSERSNVSKMSRNTVNTVTSANNNNQKPRSKSQQRYGSETEEKPKKKYLATSLMSIPNAVKLSMLNSGFISVSKFSKEEDGKVLSTLPRRPVNKEMFLKLCEERRKFPILYKVEFQIACKNEGHACRHATKASNKEKNQNQKVIPYDYNRVVLEPSGKEVGDYINASYVDSLLKPNAYIVSQGPTEETVGDFWRMIWQKGVTCIIMLTKTFDFIKVMCCQYWPTDNEPTSFGGISIKIDHEEQLANFTVRTVSMSPEGSSVQRQLLQFHYTEWPCHTSPFPTALLDFRRRVRHILDEKPQFARGQTLVHCSDGAGRSGVYCNVDANLELLEEDGLADVFGYLKKLRNSRKGLIENTDQLKFIYDTLEEYVICRKTWFPVSELSTLLKHKSMKDPNTKINEYQREFLLICKQTPRFSIGDCAGGHRQDNRDKNRDVLIIPPDNFRPYLTSFQGNAFTDYINAVFVDGYRQARGYIVTEWPLQETISYLWSLVYDYDASAVVVLSNPDAQQSTAYPPFWPDSTRSKKYGPVFTIDHISHLHFPNIKSWMIRMNKKIVSLTELMAGVKAEPKTCQLFQLTCWPMEQKVPMSTNSLVELMNMVERWRAKTGWGPVVVVSPDGRSRCGVYCAANACIEQVIQYGEVDVFTAVKTVRRHRPQMIENMTEYKYCYDVVLHYVLHYLNTELEEQAQAKANKEKKQ